MEQKNELAIQKKKIQYGLWEKLGIKVDKVMQGKGTFNMGNVGKRLFEHAQELSEITGLNKILLERFKFILSILACSYNSEKYDYYVKDTLKLYLQLYPSYASEHPPDFGTRFTSHTADSFSYREFI